MYRLIKTTINQLYYSHGN